MSKPNTLEEAVKNVNDAARSFQEHLAELPPVKESLKRLTKIVNDVGMTVDEIKKRLIDK